MTGVFCKVRKTKVLRHCGLCHVPHIQRTKAKSASHVSLKRGFPKRGTLM